MLAPFWSRAVGVICPVNPAIMVEVVGARAMVVRTDGGTEKVAAIVCAEVTLLNVYVLPDPTGTLSTRILSTRYPVAGVIV